MILRKRQKTFVERSLAALQEHRNTLAVASTGFGKSVALSAVIGGWNKNILGHEAVLAHRDELTQQNEDKFSRVNPTLTTSFFDAREKSFDSDTTFAMVQTLSRKKNLARMPPIDLLVVDEAHHVAADSYQRIVSVAKDRNPDVAIYGLTATAVRGDGKGLRSVFDNVADQVTMRELIRSGHLVQPKTFVIDVGTQGDLSQVKRTAADFDMGAVEDIMNKSLVNDAVIEHWKEKAYDRKTIVFCSTICHAEHVAKAFRKADIHTSVVHGDLSTQQRRGALEAYEKGDAQVIVNVATLTEGYDYPPTSCVVLLRPSSYHATYMQMVGRGLRTVNPDEYPDVEKTDCLVLDFGTATLTHGSLEQAADLDGKATDAQDEYKQCPSCFSQVPLRTMECPLCGHVWESQYQEKGGVLKDFVMTEIDVLAQSTFQWTDLFGDSHSFLATGFEAWAGTFFLDGQWYGVGGNKNLFARVIAQGDKTLCLAAADDWLNLYETEDGARKSQSWLQQAATAQQVKYLPASYRHNYGLTRYHASCLIAFNVNRRDIQKVINKTAKRARMAA